MKNIMLSLIRGQRVDAMAVPVSDISNFIIEFDDKGLSFGKTFVTFKAGDVHHIAEDMLEISNRLSLLRLK